MNSRGADLLVQSLVRAGTRYVFTVSGNHVMPVFDAALDAKLELIHVRHEAAAVHMADAWARVTGEVGVALVTGGPGHANAVSALYTALASQSPVLLLSGHAPTDEIGHGAFQEMRQADMAAPVTKASWTAESSDGIGEMTAGAMRLACSGWPGPVHLSLPTDVLERKTQVTAPHADAFAPERQVMDDSTTGSVLESLAAARRPLVIAGPALTSLPNKSLVARLAEALRTPVVTMESPRGINDASLGLFSEVLKQSDVVLLLGKRRDYTLKFGSVFAPNCKVLALPEDLNPIFAAEQLIAASEPDASPRSDWMDEVNEALRYRPGRWSSTRSPADGPLHALTVCAELQKTLDSNPSSILVADGGEFCQWVQGAVSPPNRIINGPAGAIGAGLPFALAAKLARPDSVVIAAMGDGTFGFHMSELDTAVRYNLPVAAVIGNDACWNAEYQIQLRTYGAPRAHGCELLPSRYEGVAQALGAYGEYVRQPGELGPALARALASQRAACLNVALQRVAAPRIERN